MQKRGIFILVIILALSSTVSAFGNARENNVQSLRYTEINGHQVRLMFQNIVDSTGTCLDLRLGNFGFFPVFYSRQKVSIYIDGQEYPSRQAQGEWRDQWVNWEHCPRAQGYGTHNREHFLEVQGDFYQEGDKLKIKVRRYGGDCEVGTFNNCFNDPPTSPYDFVETLEIPLVQGTLPTQCAPGSGLCCTSQGFLKTANDACAVGIRESTQCLQSPYTECNGGLKYRYGTQFCSGTSASCDGRTEWSEWGQCENPPNVEPEICDELDNNCNGQIDENLPRQQCMNFRTCQLYSTCETFCPPTPPEIIGNGIDDNCNGLIDQDEFNTASNPELCNARGFTWLPENTPLNQGGRCCGDIYKERPGPQGWEVPDELTCDAWDNDCDFLINEEHPTQGRICPLRCYDGTLEGQCSTTKPLFCTERGWGAILVNDAQTCGCPEGQVPSSSTSSFCVPERGNPPQILNLIPSPNPVIPGQSVTFRLLVRDTVPLSLVQLLYRRYDLGTPINQISTNPNDYIIIAPAAFRLIDTGNYNVVTGLPAPNGALIPTGNLALVDVYEGILPEGFPEGLYGFRIRVVDPFNQETDILTIRRLISGNLQLCEPLSISGDPRDKIDVIFVPQGYADNEIQYFYDLTELAITQLNGIPPFNNNYFDKFNFYRIRESTDLGCRGAGSHPFAPQLPMMVCNQLLVNNMALSCNIPLNNEYSPNSDKVIAVLNADFSSNAWLPFQRLAAPVTTHPFAMAETFVHEFGHNLGVWDYYWYRNTQGLARRLICQDDVRRQNVMCNQYAYWTFALPMNNRDSCQQRDDVPDELGQHCEDNFQSDEEYLINLLENIP